MPLGALLQQLQRLCCGLQNMMTADQLESIIRAGLHCEHLAVEGDGRHWYATIVSAEFEGKRLVARQRLVYATLGERIKTDEVHALSMKTFTPAEWADKAA